MLTKKDLEQIRIVMREEISNSEWLENRFQTLSNQIKEYVDSLHEAHDQWLKDHDVRIKKLENHTFHS